MVKIIHVLCKKLNWIEVDPAEAETQKSVDEIAVTSLHVSRIYEHTNDLSHETKLIGENSLFGSETANNDLENDSNVIANEEESQHNQGCEILATKVSASSEKIDIESNVLSQYCKNVERNKSMDLTKGVLHEAMVENTGIASDICDLQPYKCLLCNQKFSKEKYLEAHVFMTHENNDTKLSAFAHNLEINKSAHALQKPLSCSQCDYKCSTSGDLKRHEKNHTGDKPFSCCQCDYKCSTASTLKRQEKIHTGDKPFSCSKCDSESQEIEGS